MESMNMKKVLTNIQGTRFGNHLYFYLYASQHEDVLIEYVEDMDYWKNYLPSLNKYIYIYIMRMDTR